MMEYLLLRLLCWLGSQTGLVRGAIQLLLVLLQTMKGRKTHNNRLNHQASQKNNYPVGSGNCLLPSSELIVHHIELGAHFTLKISSLLAVIDFIEFL